jgi:hypothetical protein
MILKQTAGRPMSSRNVRVVPEFNKDPDIEKLGRALISLAKNLAEKKKSDELALNAKKPLADGKGDDMV